MTKKLILSSILILSSSFSFAGEDVKVPKLSNLDDKITSGKAVVLDKLPDLLANGDFTAYTVGSYIFPINGDNPEGFGGGIGINYSFSEGFEFQTHLLWTEEDAEGSSYLLDFGPAYRYTFKNDSSVYVRGLLGYKTYGEDLYYGAGVGATIPVGENISVLAEVNGLLDYGGEHASQIMLGVSYQF